MALQSEERSVPLNLNLSLKWILAAASANPGAGDLMSAGPSRLLSSLQEFI
jgi:hypothetical protein